MDNNDSEYITTTQASQYLQVTAQTLRRWEKLGKLKSYHLTPSGTRRYKLIDIQGLLQLAEETTEVEGNKEDWESLASYDDTKELAK